MLPKFPGYKIYKEKWTFFHRMGKLITLGMSDGFDTFLTTDFYPVFRNLLNFETPATKVLEVKPDVYSTRDVCYREDGLVLYEPSKTSRKEKPQFEVVLHRPYTESMNMAFSLYRSVTKEDAEVRFVTFKDKVPVFMDANKDMCTAYGLQKVCDELTTHPTWTLAHLAAHLGLSESFNNPLISNFLNSSDSITGMSPLQVAVSSSNLRTVETLVNAQSSLEHLDHNDNSVFHYASSTNKDIILALSKGSARCLNSRNKNGHTPLHMACMANKPDCVKALLLAGADVNLSCTKCSESGEASPGYVGDFMQDNPNKLYQQDMKFGGTPLHWSCSREVIQTLIQKNCNVNALNFDQRTALHIMVMRNRLECVVALLSNGADPDVGDMDGNTPLHLAVKHGSASIIQSLIVFGANLNLLNNDGASARHLISPDLAPKILYYLHAVGAARCPGDAEGCSDACACGGTYAGIPPPPIIGPANRDVLNQMLSVAGMDVCAEKHRNRKPQGGRLLCLDGGGIRGLILIQMLLELEKIVQRPIVNCFDWISGTSTGGILALGLASGKTLNEILCLYFKMKEMTFVGSRPYSSEALENILKECFGPDTVMADIRQPKLLITGVMADRKPVDLHLFRNYESPSNILEVEHSSPYELPPPPEETLLWHVGRATGAAPSYFRAFDRFLDGGLIANNPTLDAMTEIHEYNLALRAKGREDEVVPLKVVVSLGTGVVPVTQLKEIDVFRPESIWDSAKLVIGISAIGALLVDQATMSDGRVVDRARAWCSMIGVPYYRFSPQMSEEIVMDEKSDEKLVRMLWETKVYMHQNTDSMKELAVLLNN